jgi:multidrug efflux pump subunit AcrB
MADFFIRNDKFAYLLLVVLFAVGAYSLLNIPRESSPEVVVPVGIVTTVLPGAPATDIETLITNEIERGLTSLENVEDITSVSREGVSSITVEFDAAADVDESIQNLKDEIDLIKVDLPPDAEDPTVQEVDFQNQPIMSIVVSGNRSDRGFAELANQLEDEIESLPGVSRTITAGVRTSEVQVVVNQTALLQFELSISAITNAIAANNQTFPIGQIENNGVSYNIAFEGDIENTDEIGGVVVTTRGGQPVFVRDVATVIDGLSPASTLSRYSVGGEPSQNAITFNVFKQSGGDVTRIANTVNDRMAELQAPGELLDGFAVETVLDAGNDIESDLIQLSTSGLQTIALVILLLVIAIGWREGLLAGTAIPLSFLFGFIGLYLSGNSINFLSLFSLILGIGILVDSAIVMVEGINRRMKDDPTIDKKEAAVATIKEFAIPLTSGTLTTVSMFVGLFIVSGVIGQFIASIPATLIFLLFASLFVALGIIPLLAASFLKRRSATKLERRQTEYARALEAWYRTKLATMIDSPERQNRFTSLLAALLMGAILLPVNGLASAIAVPLVYLVSLKTKTWQLHRGWSDWLRTVVWLPLFAIVVGAAVFVGSTVAPGANVVKVIFFDQTDVDFIIVEIEEPEGTTKEMTDLVVRRVEDILYNEPDIASFSTTVGSGSDFGSGGSGEKFANIFISLDSERERTSTEIVDALRLKFVPINDSIVTVNQPSDGPPTGAAIVIKFLGDDLERLTALANEAALLLRDLDNTTNVTTSTNNNSTEFVLTLNRAEAATLGLDPRTVSQIARTAVFGSEATSLTTLTDDIEVVVKLNLSQTPDINPDATNEATIEALSQIPIPTPTGEVVLLGSIVDISLRESSSVIRHENQERIVSVTADVTAEGNAREVQAAAVAAIEENLDLTGITLSTGGGETEESNEAFAEMGIALIVGILLMIAVLTLQFNSYLHTRYVLTILPFSLIGIFSGLALTNSPLSFPSMMGFIALSGIVVNNSILLIDVMNQQRKRKPEKAMREVVLDAASSRLRPILLTTITTVIGVMPLTLAGDLWAPLAYALIFGLLFSVVVTLILIPVIYFKKPGTVQR